MSAAEYKESSSRMQAKRFACLLGLLWRIVLACWTFRSPCGRALRAGLNRTFRVVLGDFHRSVVMFRGNRGLSTTNMGGPHCELESGVVIMSLWTGARAPRIGKACCQANAIRKPIRFRGLDPWGIAEVVTADLDAGLFAVHLAEYSYCVWIQAMIEHGEFGERAN